MNILLLTCANEPEAISIQKALLERNLVACTKRFPISSMYLWKGNIESSNEFFLVMESDETKFSEVEATVKELHSYEQFVLVSLPVSQYNFGIEAWLKEGLKLS